MIWLTLALVAVVPEEIAVEVTTPRCELRARVPDALARALPGVAIVGANDARSSRVRFSVQVGLRVAHAVFVKLFDERDAAALVREVPLQGDACTATADGVAVIVARHLRSLGWVPPEKEDRRETVEIDLTRDRELPSTIVMPPEDAVPAIATTTVATTTVATIATAAIPASFPAPVPTIAPTSTSAFALELGAALFAGPDLLGGEGRARLVFAPIELSLAIGVSPLQNERDVLREGRAEPVGTVSYRSWHALAGVGACWPASALQACVHAEAGAETFTASAQGPRIFQRDDQTLTRPVVQAAARAEWTIEQLVSLFLSAGFRFRPVEAELAIEDAVAPIVPARFSAVGTLGARIRIF